MLNFILYSHTSPLAIEFWCYIIFKNVGSQQRPYHCWNFTSRLRSPCLVGVVLNITPSKIARSPCLVLFHWCCSQHHAIKDCHMHLQVGTWRQKAIENFTGALSRVACLWRGFGHATKKHWQMNGIISKILNIKGTDNVHVRYTIDIVIGAQWGHHSNRHRSNNQQVFKFTL